MIFSSSLVEAPSMILHWFNASHCRRGMQGLVALMFALVAMGCGGKVYEDRLEETRKYFEFIEKQNVNLTKTWTGGGVTIRVPAQFVVMPPPPVPKKDKDGNTPPPPPDKRQPDFIDGGLPGLIGAWKADFRMEGGGEAPGYLYILSNYELWLDDRMQDEAKGFHTIAVSALTGGLRVPRPPDDKWINERFPHGTGYNEQKPFTLAVLNPSPEIHGIKYDVTIYLAKQGDIQVVIALLLPQGYRPGERKAKDVSLSERMGLALETFVTQSKRPVKQKSGPPGGAGGPKPF